MIKNEKDYRDKLNLLEKLQEENQRLNKKIKELDSEIQNYKRTKPLFNVPFLDDFLYEVCVYDTYIVPDYYISSDFLDKMVELSYMSKLANGSYVVTEKLRDAYHNDEDNFPDILYKELI